MSTLPPLSEPELRPLPSKARRAWYQKELCAWYRSAKRDLPWRRQRDPYAIWISESMLQQTRVETVIPYYARFLERFPDVSSLAKAEEDEVLALWSGLGYYRRARALRAAAREIVERHAGRFPRDREEVLGLSGIGPYTAGAILSIAFGAREPLVDGNVARVFARLFGLQAPLRSPVLEKELWRLAEALVPDASLGDAGPGSWNQALMELGATLCTTKTPACASCPLAKHCWALAEGCVEALPVAAPKKELIDVELEMLFIERAGALLLVRRPELGRMAGMWELPTRERTPDHTTAGHITAGQGTTHLWPAGFSLEGCRSSRGVHEDEPIWLKHAITRHRIRARLVPGVFAGRGKGSRPGAEPRWRFASPAEREQLALTGLTQKALGRL